jgi:hypothetical protein
MMRGYAQEESIARRSRRPRRGDGVVDERALVDSVDAVREHAQGKHRTEATEGDLGVVDERALVDSVGAVREHAQGESIARRSRRPRRGIGDGWTRELWWTALASVREQAQVESIARRSRRPRRGTGGGGRVSFGGQRGLPCGNRRMGKASHGGHGGHGGGLGGGGRASFGGQRWLPGGNRREGKASHGGHGGNGGGCLVDSVGLRAGIGAKGKHRTG